MPVLIYNTSWNDPGQSGETRLAVWVANNQDRQIDHIRLGVAACGAKGSIIDPAPLLLGGPFYGHHDYVSLPSWPVDAHYFPVGGTSYANGVVSSEHMIIQSIEITYADDTRQTYDGDVAQLLTSNISNFCPVAPVGSGVLNLP